MHVNRYLRPNASPTSCHYIYYVAYYVARTTQSDIALLSDESRAQPEKYFMPPRTFDNSRGWSFQAYISPARILTYKARGTVTKIRCLRAPVALASGLNERRMPRSSRRRMGLDMRTKKAWWPSLGRQFRHCHASAPTTQGL